MRRGAPSTVVSPCRCLVTAVVRPSRQCPSVCSAELSYCGSTRWRLAGGACGERPSGRASLRRPGMPGRRPCRPSPARVHRWVSTHPVPTSGVRSSNRPVSSRPVSSRPVSGQLVPSSGHLVSARPPGHLLVCVSPAVPWDHIGAAGNLDGRDGSGCRWSAVSRAAWSTARVRLKGGDAVEVVGRWGSGGRGPGRVGLGHRLRRARPLAGRGGQLGVRVAGRCRLT
jgi:hypothetical protein